MFEKPKNLTPESIVKSMLHSPGKSGIRPEDLAQAVSGAGDSPTASLLGLAKKVLSSGQQPTSQALSPLDRAIVKLASQHEGVVTRPLVEQSLQVSRYEAQAGLDGLANRGIARRVRGRHEVVYLFEEYLEQQQKAPQSSPVGGIIQAAVWAYGRWNAHQKALAQQEQQLLDLAYHNRGWFTHTQAVHTLGRDTEACVERLKEAGLLEQMNGKNNQPVYVVQQFLPPTVVCGYCQAIYDVGEVDSCRKCGAILAT